MGDPRADDAVPSTPGDARAESPQTEASELERLKSELAAARDKNAKLLTQVDELKSFAAAPAGKPADLQRLHLLQIQAVRDLLVMSALAMILWLGYKLSLVTVPILLALLLAYLFEPLVRWMTRRGWFSRPGATLLIIFTTLLLVLVPASLGVGTAVVQGARLAQGVQRTSTSLLTVMRFTQHAADEGEHYGTVQIVNRDTPSEAVIFRAADDNDDAKHAAARADTAFSSLRPQLREVVRKLIKHHLEVLSRETAGEVVGPPALTAAKTPWWLSILDLGVSWLQNNTEAVAAAVGKGALGTGAEAVGAAMRTLKWLGRAGLTVLLTAFFFYFFSTGYGRLQAFWAGLIPQRKKGRVIELLQMMDRVIAGFVRGRLTICATLMVYYTIVYWLIGVPAPLVLGPIVGAFALVPFLTTLAIPVAIAFMTLDPSGGGWQENWWWILGAPIGAYIGERAIDDYFLTPAIQGRNTEMAVPAILFASLAGGVLAGVYGLLIGIPVAACLKILLREVFWPRFKAWGEGRVKDFLPISRYDPTETTSKG